MGHTYIKWLFIEISRYMFFFIPILKFNLDFLIFEHFLFHYFSDDLDYINIFIQLYSKAKKKTPKNKCVIDRPWKDVLSVCERPAMEKRSVWKYRAYFVLLGTYSAETWTLSVRETMKVEDIGTKFVRSMLVVTRRKDIRKLWGHKKYMR
uniref:Uncharacterized protein n=1 Tax=Timema shepardi TaxID=629360 RepID=A0A7R9AW15_TIMSH|nr:unnamed protein product [Timema shepardi]